MSHYEATGNPGGLTTSGQPSGVALPGGRLAGCAAPSKLTPEKATAAGTPSGAAPLGTSTKSHSASSRHRKGDSPATARAKRYLLQHIAADLLPNERVSKCLRWRQSKERQIQVWRSVEHKKAHYKGLQVCGSVWVCPVCAAKISERRRAELCAAIATHKATGGGVLLLTLTNSHDRRDRLVDLLEGQALALTRFRGGRVSTRLFDAIGTVGMVRTLEVTHGGNGWHPHYHILVFTRSPLSRAAVKIARDRFAQHWRDCCQASGLPLPDLEHGVDLRAGDWAARYASKWGLEDEMTKGHIKAGRKSKTPWDLLRASISDAKGDQFAEALFREYAETFKGRRQLVWSKGLKAALAVEDLSDEEIAQRADDEAEHVLTLEHDDWLRVCRWLRRWEVLDRAEQGGSSAVIDLLHQLAVLEGAEKSLHVHEVQP